MTPPEKISDFLQAYFGKPRWRDFVDAVDPQTVLWSLESPLVSILLATEEWCAPFVELNRDSGAVVLVKKELFMAMSERTGWDECDPLRRKNKTESAT